MKHLIPTFFGYKQYRLDSKRLVTIPPAWRPAEGAVVFVRPSMKNDMPLLSVLSSTAYDNEVKRIVESGMSQRAIMELLGKLAMISSEISINDQVKLLIPKDLCERAGFVAEADVVHVGRWEHFEIWNKESFDRAQDIEFWEIQADGLGIL